MKKVSTIKSYFLRDKKIFLFSLMLGLIITTVITFYSKSYSENIQAGLAKNLIRFHVIANSDSPYDQQMKRDVRDAILESMDSVLEDVDSIKKTRQLLTDNADYMKQIAERVITEWGADYQVSVSLGSSVFPTKRYGDVVLPPGEYEALRVEIGDAKGQNWWCVMFPPLCFVDITHGVVPEKSKTQLKNILTDDEFDLVLATRKDKNLPIKLKFRIVEWWQEKYLKNSLVFANKK